MLPYPMNRCSPTRSRVMAGLAVLVLAFVGCDAASDPVALLLTDETRASVLLEGDLPALAYLAEEFELEGELGEAVALWERSWEEEGIQRWALRMAAYDYALPVLRRESMERQRKLVETVREASLALEPIPAEALPPELRRELTLALEGSHEAEVAWREGRWSESLYQALEAADRVRELTPPVVAERLVRRVEDDLTALGNPAFEGDEESFERVLRLLRGARYALSREDYPQAIRRAHYAHQLLRSGAAEPR